MDLFFRQPRVPPASALVINGIPTPVVWVPNGRARRYFLRVRACGAVRVTIPRGGNLAEAQKFVERNTAWLVGALERAAAKQKERTAWDFGSEVLFLGEKVRIERSESGTIRLGESELPSPSANQTVQGVVQAWMQRRALQVLPERTLHFAGVHALQVRRITLRSQKTRWGSCSSKGAISLNWRLIQTPSFAQDYVILHELMHLRHMNHSAKFWEAVEQVCPDYKAAEKWLKTHTHLLR